MTAIQLAPYSAATRRGSRRSDASRSTAPGRSAVERSVSSIGSRKSTIFVASKAIARRLPFGWARALAFEGRGMRFATEIVSMSIRVTNRPPSTV